MSSDYLIKIDGINGESKDKDFKDYIEVFGWSFSAQAPMDAISRQRTGKTVVSDLTLVKAIDKSSVTLIERCVRNNNQPKDKATLICRKAGGKQYGFFQIDLKKVRVRSVNTIAIALYKKLGFTEEGRMIKRLKIGPDSYLDDVVMALWVGP